MTLLAQSLGYLVGDLFFMLFLMMFIPLRYSVKKTAGICLLTVLCIRGLDGLRLEVFQNESFPAFLLFCLQIILVHAAAYLVSAARNSKVIFTSLSASSYIMAGDILGTVVYCIGREYIPAFLTAYLVHAVLLWFLVRYVRKPYLKLLRKDIRSFHKLCAIPVLFYLTLYLLCFYHNPLFENPENIPVALLMLATMFVSYIIVFRSVEMEYQRSELQADNRILESYEAGLVLQYKAVESIEREMKILRHDLRHYIASMSVLLEEGDYDEIRKILDNLQGKIESKTLQRFCDNTIINSILCSMAAKAEESKVRLVSTVSVPEKVKVDVLRLSAVLANLLENAIHSAAQLREEEDKKVSLLMRCDDKLLILEVRNKFDGTVEFDENSGLPVRRSGRGHGVGLQSVKTFVENHGASFDCYVAGNLFTARLLLHL